MEKTIKIQDQELKLKSSLGTIISYRSIFGSELFSDIKILDDIKDKDEISRVIDVIFRITYVLHRPYTTKTYEEFLDDLDFSIIGDTKTLEELAQVIGELLGTVTKNK